MSAELNERYEIGVCLGRGGFGEVYLADHVAQDGRREAVAIKVLLPGVSLRSDAVRRLKDEARVLARLDHPAILRVRALVTLSGRVALVAEYVDGADLGELAGAEGGAIHPRAALEAAAAIASALDAAWRTPGADGSALQLVHRDLKPANIRIDRRGRACLLDFGVAWFNSGEREARTAADMVVGSLPYMAPERFVSTEAGAPIDVYALGVSLIECWSGQPFFASDSLRDVVRVTMDEKRFRAHVQERLSVVQPGISVTAKAWLGTLLAFSPAQRPTAAQAAQGAQRLLAGWSGPSLKGWCGARSWPDVPHEAGPLSGQVLSPEGVVEVLSRGAGGQEPTESTVRHKVPMPASTVGTVWEEMNVGQAKRSPVPTRPRHLAALLDEGSPKASLAPVSAPSLPAAAPVKARSAAKAEPVPVEAAPSRRGWLFGLTVGSGFLALASLVGAALVLAVALLWVALH